MSRPLFYRFPRRFTVVLAGLLVAGILTPGVAGIASAASWQPPGFVRSLGGRGEAGVYPWGMEYNPVSDEILVGDYWNFKIRRYDRVTGRQLGAFFRAPNLRKGQPYTISVNPLNGDIFVPELGDGQERGYIAQYDKAGNYIREITVAARYQVWTHIDAHGFLWVADSHYWNTATSPSKIRKYSLGSTPQEVLSFGTHGSGPGQLGSDVHGISTDNTGNVYVADAPNRNVHVFSPTGAWLRDFGSSGTLSQIGRFTGDLRGLEIDRVNGWVYVVDAQAGQIEKFDLAGNPLAHSGSEGSGPGQFGDGARELAVDNSGHLWAADYGNYRIFEYDTSGAFLRALPDPAQPPPPGNFSQNRDVAVDPVNGDVVVADSWNNRFQRFGPDGSFLGAWGARNSHAPYGMDYPRGIAVEPVSRNVWVSDTRDQLIRVYDTAGGYLRTLGTGVSSESPGAFKWPMDIEFAAGKAYVSNYSGATVRILDVTSGNEIGTISGSNNGVAVDPASGNIYVLSWSRDRVSAYTANGSFIRSFGSSGTGSGQFQNPWDIDIVNQTVYVTDANLGRVQAFDLNGTYLGQWGTKGTGAFQFNGPSGISHDAAGNIYVADAGNNRVQVFSTAVPKPNGDSVAPAGTLTFPLKNAVLAAVSPALVRGAASDAVGVAKVEVAVKDTVRNVWWNANDAVWQPLRAFNSAAWAGSSATSVTYDFSFIAIERSGRYSALTRATDTSGNTVITPAVPFSISP
jgi:sugar lactone lactonase YvrE